MVDVVLDELDSDGVKVELSDVEAAALVRTRLVEVRPEGGGAWRVLPNGRAGAARIGDHQVQVNPKGKVGVAHLLFLLGYAKDPGFREEDVLGLEAEELWPALAYALTRQVTRALRQGVAQGYRTVDDALRTVRGRIRIADQISARPGMMLPLEVTYDEFTVDTAENQILRAALRRMLAVPRLDQGVRREMLHLDGRLDGVSVLRRGAPLPRWAPTRTNERYHGALRLSEVVLRNSAAEPASGHLVVSSFVVSMPTVFENFVTTALTEALAGVPGRTRAQYGTHLDETGGGPPAVPMKVDIVHLDARGRPAVAFDAKYKASRDEGGYPTADYYQMLAYCTALDIPCAWLVYAQGAAGVARRRIRHTGKAVIEYPLDLAASPQAVLRQVSELAHMAMRQEESSLVTR